jgi:hypothetical protein
MEKLKVLPFILFLLIATSTSVLSAEESFLWEPMSAPGVKKMLKSKKYNDTFLSEMEEKRVFDLSKFEPSIYIQALPEIRINAHELIGITDYKINSSIVKRAPAAWMIEVEGSFLRKGKEHVLFCESHIFKADQFSHRQLNLPVTVASQVLKNKEKCLHILNSEFGK